MSTEKIGEEGENVLIWKVLEGVFTKPSRFVKAASTSQEVKAGEPVGVATLDSLLRELELLGLGREDRRRIATKITGGLLKGERFGLFSMSDPTKIDKMIVDKDFLFYRDDLKPAVVAQRYNTYFEKLVEETEALRQSKAQNQAQPPKVAKKPVSVRQAKFLISVIPALDQGEIERKVSELREKVGNNSKVSRLEVDFSNFLDPSISLFDRGDIRFILTNGISPSAVRAALPEVRLAITETSESIEADALSAANFIEAEAQRRAAQSKKDLLFAISTPRILAPVLNSLIYERGLTRDKPTRLQEEATYDMLPPYPYQFLRLWNLRSGLSDLNLEAIFPEEDLVRALFAEVIGEMYPNAYNYLQEELRHGGLQALRLLTEDFGIGEINAVLEPQYIDTEGQKRGIAALKKQIDDKEKEIRALKSPQAKGREALVKAKDQLMSDLRKLVIAHGQKSKSTFDRVNEALLTHFPQAEPQPRDYFKGALSPGYRDAKKRYEMILAKNPGYLAPDPDEYTQGDKSEGYLRLLSFHQAWAYIHPATIKRREEAFIEPSGRVTRPLPSIVGIRLFGVNLELGINRVIG